MPKPFAPAPQVSEETHVPETQVKRDETPSTRVTILSELDSYISERMKEQPTSLTEVANRVEVTNRSGSHRMSLPTYFTQYSADDQKAAGPYAFRWVLKVKRSIDDHLAKGWLFVNRAYFPDAPRYLFTANGGVELGDTMLAFLPIKQAKLMRERPAKLSQERLKGQMTTTGPDTVLMTGNQHSPHVYQPELGAESAETSSASVPGVLTEGRDF